MFLYSFGELLCMKYLIKLLIINILHNYYYAELYVVFVYFTIRLF